jgi:hypothetical protein
VVSNWRFCRDVVKDCEKRGPVLCKIEHCTVSFKFSSTAFISKGKEEEVFHFDKNGACIPYSAFVALLCDEPMQKFLAKVTEKFEAEQGPVHAPASLLEQQLAAADDSETVVVVEDDEEGSEKRKKKSAKHSSKK